jgi:hypothetical protein
MPSAIIWTLAHAYRGVERERERERERGRRSEGARRGEGVKELGIDRGAQ